MVGNSTRKLPTENIQPRKKFPSNHKRWRKRTRFTPEFKAELVFEVLSGATSQAEVCRRHNLNENQLSQWKRQLLENAPMLFESTDKQSSDAEKRIAHLEQLVGRMAVALDIKLLTGSENADWLDSVDRRINLEELAPKRILGL